MGGSELTVERSEATSSARVPTARTQPVSITIENTAVLPAPEGADKRGHSSRWDGEADAVVNLGELRAVAEPYLFEDDRGRRRVGAG